MALLASMLVATLLLAGDAGAQFSSYAPSIGACPSTSLLRQSNGSLASAEASYVNARRQASASSWSTAAQAAGYSRLSSPPTTAIACSGGGYRASLYCAGVLSAFDARNTSSPVSGILDRMTYIGGLSGGSWTVASYMLNNAPAIYDLVLGNSSGSGGWNLDRDLLVPGGAAGIVTGNNGDFYDVITADVKRKEAAGFETSITDYWGRALSYHFFPGTTEQNFYTQNNGNASHAAGLLFGSIANTSSYQSNSVPFPIVVCDSRPPTMASNVATPFSAANIPLSSIVYEFSAVEFGTYDARLRSFITMQYLGTQLNSGSPPNSSACVQGFQNAGYVIGTSSSLFNAILSTVNSTLTSADASALEFIFNKIDGGVRNANDDISSLPNPFGGLNASYYQDTASVQLDLVDGGEDGQNVPLEPFLTPARAIDAIIAADASADTTLYYPNATSIIATRDKVNLSNGTLSFPTVPSSMAEFVAGNLSTRPTFLGCNDTNGAPLIVYLPNAPPLTGSAATNTSTFKLSYSDDEARSFLDQAHNVAARGWAQNGTADSQWPVCLSCALLERQRVRQGVARSPQCSMCFSRYCYVPGSVPSSAVASAAAAVGSGTAAPSSSSSAQSSAAVVSAALGRSLVAVVSASWLVLARSAL